MEILTLHSSPPHPKLHVNKKHIYIYIYICHSHVYIHMSLSLYIYNFICMACLCIMWYVYIYVYMYISMYIHISYYMVLETSSDLLPNVLHGRGKSKTHVPEHCKPEASRRGGRAYHPCEGSRNEAKPSLVFMFWGQ